MGSDRENACKPTSRQSICATQRLQPWHLSVPALWWQCFVHLVVLGFLKTNVAGPAPHDLRTHSSTSHLTHPGAPAHPWSPNMTGPEAPKGLPTQTNEIHQPQMGGPRLCMPFRMSHRACPGENVAVIGCLKAGHRSCSNVLFLVCLGPRHMRGQMAHPTCVCLCACFAFVVWLLMCVLPSCCPSTQVPT